MIEWFDTPESQPGPNCWRCMASGRPLNSAGLCSQCTEYLRNEDEE